MLTFGAERLDNPSQHRHESKVVSCTPPFIYPTGALEGREALSGIPRKGFHLPLHCSQIRGTVFKKKGFM